MKKPRLYLALVGICIALTGCAETTSTSTATPTTTSVGSESPASTEKEPEASSSLEKQSSEEDSIGMDAPCKGFTYQKECIVDGEYYLIKSDVLDLMLMDCDIVGEELQARLYYHSKVKDVPEFPLTGFVMYITNLYAGDRCLWDNMATYDQAAYYENNEGMMVVKWDIHSVREDELKGKDICMKFELGGFRRDDPSEGPIHSPVITEEKLKLCTWDKE